MFDRDPRVDPNSANVFDHDTHQPYARRSIRAVVGFVLIIMVIGGFVGWYFFSTDNSETVTVEVAENAEGGDVIEVHDGDFGPPVTDDQAPGNEYAENSGRGIMYDFFYQIFGGIEDGLENSPHNLENIEQTEKMNIDTDELFSGSSSAPAIAVQEALATTPGFQSLNDGYRHSARDVIGSGVTDSQGKPSGKVHDILINKETGEAKAIVVNKEGGYYDRDLKLLTFENVLTQEPDGDVQTNITDQDVEGRNAFDYAQFNTDVYISLGQLGNGQVLDYQGKVSGQIDAIIYQNAQAQRIFFALEPSLSPDGKSKVFGLPYEEINIVKNPDGYDVLLTKEQTESLAETLFGGPKQAKAETL